MTDTPEMDRLTERLRGARNFNVFWGDRAHELTVEQRAALINKAMDDVADGRATRSRLPPTSRPAVNVRDWLAERGL